MAYIVESRTGNAATKLREALDKAERLVVQLNGENVEEFLLKLDEIETDLAQLHQEGGDFRPEQARWDSILSRLHHRPEPVVRAAQVAGGLGTLRAKHPPATSFWWYLDQELARRRGQSLRRMLITIVSVVAIAVIAFWAVNTFFPPDPEAVLMVETTNTLDQYIANQRWEEALQLVEDTRAELPTQPDLAIWQVVLNEQLGRTAAATAALEEAHTLMGDPVQVWTRLGTNRLQVGNLEGAEQAAEEARTLDPEEPQVYFLLGGIAETRGDVQTAIAYFDQTFNLARDANPQLAVIARVRMGQLLQSPGTLFTPEADATPTP